MISIATQPLHYVKYVYFMNIAHVSIRQKSAGERLLVVFTFAVIICGAALPLLVAHYPLSIDFPTHVNQGAILRHYFDPAFHFREQFAFKPFFTNPNYSAELLTAGFSFILPIHLAGKWALFLLLLLLPAGVVITLRAMGKSIYWSLATVPLMWGTFTHWGFINFVPAIGLAVAVVGLTMMLAERPTVFRLSCLITVLMSVYITHIALVPFAIASLVLVGLISRKTKRFWVYWMISLAVIGGLFLLWFRSPWYSSALSTSFKFEGRRVMYLFYTILHSFLDPKESYARVTFVAITALVGGANFVGFLLRWRWKGWPATRAWFGGALTLLVVFVFAMGLFLGIPDRIGAQGFIWSYVSTRMALIAALFGIPLLPDFPKSLFWRAPLVLAVGLAGFYYVVTISQYHANFDKAEYASFRKVVERLPMAPKLFYLPKTSQRHGSAFHAPNSFLHLHEYIQAEHGGWINANLVLGKGSWLIYRNPKDRGALPPPMKNDVRNPFYDWILVRADEEPTRELLSGMTVREVAHENEWWLYRRGETQ